VTAGSNAAAAPVAPAIVRGRLTERVPAYPVLLVCAWLISLLSESGSSVQGLPRPLLVGVVLVLIVQVALSLVVRNRHVAAILVVLLELTVFGMIPVALAGSALLAVGMIIAARQHRTLGSLPLGTATRGLNVVLSIVLGLVVATSFQAGALTPPEDLQAAAIAQGAPDLPDIYLVLLDGYPRSDTLADDFAFDNEPFLASLGGSGFEVARHSHSNYNGTELTLASMFNAAQVPSLAEVTGQPSSPAAQVRALTHAINHGRAIDALRAQGYEIVTIPSVVTSPTLYDADRVLDSGQVNSFELEVLREGILPLILPDVQRRWLIEQHRDRIITTFDRLGALAAERADHPRFIFAHIMGPHAPIAFGPAGEPRYAWPCFPISCSIFDGGQIYGNDILVPIREEVQYLDSKVLETAAHIQAASARPPVIVFFSDHGSRYDFDDRDEMLRSFFVSTTPGRPGLFPADVAPINLIPRLLNAYAGTQMPLATEESYVVDMRTVNATGLLTLIPWSIHEP
jgi:hypothetical protein